MVWRPLIPMMVSTCITPAAGLQAQVQLGQAQQDKEESPHAHTNGGAAGVRMKHLLREQSRWPSRIQACTLLRANWQAGDEQED